MSVCVAGAGYLFLRACRCCAVSVLGVTVCACLWVSALVCVPVVRPAALWVSVWQVLRCVVLWVSAGAALGVCLWGVCAVVISALLSIKTRVYSDFIMQRII